MGRRDLDQRDGRIRGRNIRRRRVGLVARVSRAKRDGIAQSIANLYPKLANGFDLKNYIRNTEKTRGSIS